MIKVRKRSCLKRFASEEQVDQLGDVIDVNVVDEEGNPLEESELKEDQIKFAAKVAMRVYKKFAKSKKVMFDSEEDQITVVVPDSIPVDPQEMEEQVQEAVAESIEEFNEDPDEVSIEVTEDAEEIDEPEVTEEPEETEVETTEETIENEEPETEEFSARKRNKKFSKKRKDRKIHRFTSEELEEAEETEDELEKDVDEMGEEGNMPEEEGADTLPKEPKENIGTRAFTSKKNRRLDVIDRALGSDGVAGFKQKFFASKC